MPQIQIIENPYANSMRDASTGLNALTQANEALRARRAQKWKMLEDLPEDVKRVARRAFAESDLDVDTDVGPAAPSQTAPAPAAVSGGGLQAIEKVTPKETSLLGKISAMFSPAPEPAENPNYDENRVGKSTLTKLAGENAALGRNIPEAEAKEILSRGGKGMNYGGVMTTFEGGSQDPQYTLNGRTAPDEAVNAMADQAGEVAMRAGSADPQAYDRALRANIAKYSAMEKLDPEVSQEMFNFGVKKFGNNAFSAENMAKTVAAFAASKTPKVAAGIPATEAQLEPGPEIYDDSAQAIAQHPAVPAQGSGPAPQMAAGGRQSYGQSRASSFRGAQGSQFGPQGAVADEDVANIDFLANDWAGAQTGYSKAMLYAKRIKDPAASAAAMQYVNSKFQNRMGSYDDGVSKEMVQMSDREASRGSNGGSGFGSSEYGTDGFMPVNGQWFHVFQANSPDPDLNAVAALMSVKYGAKNHIDLLNAAHKTLAMADQGNPVAKKLLEKARTTVGLATGKLYPEEIANKHPINDQMKGITIDSNSLSGMDEVYGAAPAEDDVEGGRRLLSPRTWFTPEASIAKGQLVTRSEAGMIRARKREKEGEGGSAAPRQKLSGVK